MDRQEGSLLTPPCCASPAAQGRAPIWMGLGRTGRSARGRAWTLSPWTTRTAEPRAARRPGPARHVAARRPAPFLPGLPRSRKLGEMPCSSFVFVPLGFFSAQFL